MFFLITFFLYFLIFTSPAFAVNPTINEFVAHPSSDNDEWVEFYNPDGTDLTVYWLDDDTNFNDDSGSSGKKSLTSLNASDPQHPYLQYTSSFLNNDEDYVVLFAPDGTLLDQYQYEEDPGTDFAFGRSPDGTGSFSVLASQTKGAANSSPVPTPSPTPDPTPSPSPSPTPKATPSPSPSPIKSPTPTPKPSPKPTPSPSPSSSPTPQVLGEVDKSSPTSSPSPSTDEATTNGTSRIKFAGLLVGSGAVLIGASFGFYLWYKRALEQKKPDE